MIETLVVVVLLLVAWPFLMRLLTLNAYWHKRDRDFFGEAVRQFLIYKDDGAELVFRQCGASVSFSIRRGPGDSEEGAVATLVIPARVRARWK